MVGRACTRLESKAMEVSVRQHGGVFGIDRRVDVKEGVVEVVENGVHRKTRRLTVAERARLDDVAVRVVKSKVDVSPLAGGPPPDTMHTSIELKDSAGGRSLQLSSGDEAPDEVWELLGAVEKVSAD